MSFIKPNATFSFPSFKEIVNTFAFSVSNEDSANTICKPGQDMPDHTTKKSLGSQTSSPTPVQKRSFVDMTMQITEAAEDVFLFGSGQYHERPVKRRRFEPGTGRPQDENGVPLPDFQLSVEAVWHHAQASSSLLDSADD